MPQIQRRTWFSETGFGGLKDIPAGAYIAVVLNAMPVSNVSQSGKKYNNIEIRVEIAEGDYKGYFTKQNLARRTAGQKETKGVYELGVPDEGAQETDIGVRIFNSTMKAFADSNDGYHWNDSWNTDTLKGKKIGICVREREFRAQDGTTGVVNEIGALYSVASVRDGTAKLLDRKKLKDSDTAAPEVPEGFSVPAENDDIQLPF